jgi:hypothetical protein
VGQHIVKLQLRRITCAAVDMHNASTWDLHPHTQSVGIRCGTPRSMEEPRPKHAVTEGLLAFAEDKRPGANWRIELQPHASQRHIKAWQNLCWHSISWLLIKSIMQYRIANYGEVFILQSKH